jgi:hypothetical protein
MRDTRDLISVTVSLTYSSSFNPRQTRCVTQWLNIDTNCIIALSVDSRAQSLENTHINPSTGMYNPRFHRTGITECRGAGDGDNLVFVSSFCEDSRPSTIALFCWQTVSSSLPPYRHIPPSGGKCEPSSISVLSESVVLPFGRSNRSSY